MSVVVNGSALWYASRGTGLGRLRRPLGEHHARHPHARSPPAFTLPRFAVADIHRNISLLFVTFLAIHIATAVIDPYVVLNVVDVVVPFGGSYHPMVVGLGAIGVDLLLAVLITSALAQPALVEGLASRALAGLRHLGAGVLPRDPHGARHRTRHRPAMMMAGPEWSRVRLRGPRPAQGGEPQVSVPKASQRQAPAPPAAPVPVPVGQLMTTTKPAPAQSERVVPQQRETEPPTLDIVIPVYNEETRPRGQRPYGCTAS